MTDAVAALRERLAEMRRELIVAMLRDGPEASYLSLMAGVAATLEALDQCANYASVRNGE